MALVAGSALEDRGLLAVPREGGRAELRALTDPNIVRWSGRTVLPPAVEVRGAGRTVVLREADGAVHRYDPARDQLRPIGDVAEDARWVPAAEGGAFVGSRGILAVTGTDARAVEARGVPLWAAPARGGAVVGLVELEGRVRAVYWPADGSEPTPPAPLSVRPPALAVEPGGMMVAATADGGLAAHDLPGFERIESRDLDAPVTGLVASPSSHRLYVALGGERGGLRTIERFGWSVHELDGVAGPVRELRVSVLGDYLLAFDGTRARAVEMGGGTTVTGLEWGADLPIGLPGGRLLGRRDGRLVVVAPEGGEATPVEIAAPAWWVAVPWAPARTRTRIAGAGEEDDGAAAGSDPAGRSVGLGTATRPIGAADESPVETAAAADEGAPLAEGDEGSIPAGFYAVAASARQIESVRTLQRALERSGYPSHIFTRRDEANDLWYRVMVGPYGSRDAADEIARRLRGERGIRAWIREVPSAGALGTGTGLP